MSARAVPRRQAESNGLRRVPASCPVSGCQGLGMDGVPYVTGRIYPMDPRGVLEGVVSSGPFVFLETANVTGLERRSYLFSRPVEVLEVREPCMLGQAMERGERALRQGYWLAGFWAYELGYLLEPKLSGLLPSRCPRGPLMWLGVFNDPETWVHDLEGPSALLDDTPDISRQMGPLELDVGRSRYAAAVERIKRYIRNGHTYQVNYTLRGRFGYSGSPTDMYLALRARQAVSYGGLIGTGKMWVVSMSPELFFHRTGDWIWSRPMKGTVGRGRTLEEDRRLARFLGTDPKNMAENVMIVDLLRNDLGRLCRLGSVYVPDLFTVERYQTLFQMTSTVRGRLEGDPPWHAILKALFPCGSVTGAPKVRTMEIIAELEASPRGVYTGSVGFFSPHGEACLNVAIRTVVLQDGTGELGIGSGITIDSDPDAEFEECLLKADFLNRRFREFRLIETLRWEPGRGFDLLERHVDRLLGSAEYFSFHASRKELVAGLEAASRGFGNGAHRVRLTLSRDGTIAIEASPIQETLQPVPFDLSPERVDPGDPYLFHKTTNRELFDREHDRAARQGLFDVVFLNTRGELTQGAISNIFLDLGTGLLTPCLESGLLPGTLRQRLIDEGRAREAVLHPRDIARARAVYLGNSVRGLLKARPVRIP